MADRVDVYASGAAGACQRIEPGIWFVADSAWVLLGGLDAGFLLILMVDSNVGLLHGVAFSWGTSSSRLASMLVEETGWLTWGCIAFLGGTKLHGVLRPSSPPPERPRAVRMPLNWNFGRLILVRRELTLLVFDDLEELQVICCLGWTLAAGEFQVLSSLATLRVAVALAIVIGVGVLRRPHGELAVVSCWWLFVIWFIFFNWGVPSDISRYWWPLAVVGWSLVGRFEWEFKWKNSGGVSWWRDNLNVGCWSAVDGCVDLGEQWRGSLTIQWYR